MNVRRVRSIGVTTLALISIFAGVAIAASTHIDTVRNCTTSTKGDIPPTQRCWTAPSHVASTSQISLVEGSQIGTLYIPSINKRVNIFQGTSEKTLKNGVGHYIRSVMPGAQDNSVLSGHRDTVFSDLGKVKIGAFIMVDTQNGSYIYKVNRIRIVGKNDRTVIVPTPTAVLTLSTCYPFSYIGPAPKRYVVQARLMPLEPQS